MRADIRSQISCMEIFMKFKPAEEIENALKGYADNFGFEIVEVAVKNGKEPSLTVYLDKDGGIDLNDCEKFHNAIDAPLDELDPSYGAGYTLNVSSSGLDRAFKRPRDYEKNIGGEVEVKLFAPLKGKKLLEGTLTAYDGNTVTLESGGETVKIELTRIAKINKAIKF